MKANLRHESMRLLRCARKRNYKTWDEARLAGIAVWQESPRNNDANMPTPYPCDLIGDPHYHIGHLRFTKEGK